MTFSSLRAALPLNEPNKFDVKPGNFKIRNIAIFDIVIGNDLKYFTANS